MALFYFGALAAAVALDVALIVYWRRYNAARMSQNLSPLDARSATSRAKEWMGRVTLLEFARMLAGHNRWRIWLLILAVSLALVAQNSFPPPDVTLTDQQPLPDPLWKTLLFLEGPLEPFRQAVWLYAVVVLLVLIAYSGEAIDALPWRTLNLASPETDNEATSLPAHSHSQFDFTVARWRFAVGIEGPQNPWAATLLMAALMIVALGLAVCVFFIFNQPLSASNPGLALWLLSIFLVLAATAIYDVSHGHLSGRPGASFNRLMTTSLVVVVISVGLLWRGQGIPGMLLWAASLLALGTGWWAARRAGAPKTTQRLSLSLWLELFLFIAIIGVASYFRLARITELAPGINNDAAETGRVAD